MTFVETSKTVKMTANNWKMAGIFFLGMVAGWTVGSFLWNGLALRYMNAYQNVYDDWKYFSEGSINRGLVDICEVDGELKVLFKEDCPK